MRRRQAKIGWPKGKSTEGMKDDPVSVSEAIARKKDRAAQKISASIHGAAGQRLRR